MEIQVHRADITKLKVDCIVNAANSGLLGGSGVDGAIHRAGGPEILAQCQEIIKEHGPLPPGEAVITGGGRLPARWVIHTVGPIWQGGSHYEAELLFNAYYNSLKLAVEAGCSSIAYPNISTGAYAYPKDQALSIVQKFLNEVRASPEFSSINLLILAAFDEENYNLYKGLSF